MSNVIRAAPRAAQPVSRAPGHQSPLPPVRPQVRIKSGGDRRDLLVAGGELAERLSLTIGEQSIEIGGVVAALHVVALPHQPQKKRNRRADAEHLVLTKRARHASDGLAPDAAP